MEILELWKEISGYEQSYAISNYGKVKSLKRNLILKNIYDKKGYLYVGLCKNGKETKFKIHRLVGIHFLNNFDNLPQIDHIDRVKDNNLVSNLRWVNNSINAHNSSPRKNGTSKFKGVSFDSSAKIKKWRAIVSADKHNYHLGRFLTELEAHNAVTNFKLKKQLILWHN
jgi:hypothetical protein